MKLQWPVSAARATLMAVMVSMLALAAAKAQQVPEGLGQGWLGEFDHSSKQLTQLAEATPADKFAWRPAPGVRSVSEVYMHIALGNYFLLGQAGVKLPDDVTKLGKDPEKALTAKADVIALLKKSFENVRTNYPTADKSKALKFFGRDATIDGVYLRILVHNHEHMGQSIAYARMMGVVPPWSATSGGE
jgi:uncharacterized damage-inducible protein DinB